jgi:hypothetical protein
VPWEVGPQYWSRFENAAEWTDPSFFPIVAWYAGVSSPDEVAWDRAHGVNTYIGMWEGTDFSLLADNGAYWIGGALNDSFDPSSPHWPGVLLDDEVDGRFAPAEGLDHLRALSDDAAGQGRFRYANFTQLVIGADLDVATQEQYVNEFTDVVSVDMYWYTIPFCDWQPYRGELYAVPVPQQTCRSAASYGATVRALTLRDAADDRLQPRWQLVENLNGLSGQQHLREIAPAEVEGAAMASVIAEARGLVWFNQSFTGSCQTSNALRDAQVQGAGFCGAAQIEAMGRVNRTIHRLAPVLNTQSYVWEFGPRLNTMLKTWDGSAYVFAMTDGTPGRRIFALPPGVNGREVEVVGEGRTIAVDDGAFADDFATEAAWHIYRVPLTDSAIPVGARSG